MPNARLLLSDSINEQTKAVAKSPKVLLRARPTLLGSTKLVTTANCVGLAWSAPLWHPWDGCALPRGAFHEQSGSFHTYRGAELFAVRLQKDALH